MCEGILLRLHCFQRSKVKTQILELLIPFKSFDILFNATDKSIRHFMTVFYFFLFSFFFFSVSIVLLARHVYRFDNDTETDTDTKGVNWRKALHCPQTQMTINKIQWQRSRRRDDFGKNGNYSRNSERPFNGKWVPNRFYYT